MNQEHTRPRGFLACTRLPLQCQAGHCGDPAGRGHCLPSAHVFLPLFCPSLSLPTTFLVPIFSFQGRTIKIRLDLENSLQTLIPIIVVIFLEGEEVVFGLGVLDQAMQERHRWSEAWGRRLQCTELAGPAQARPPRSDCPPPR